MDGVLRVILDDETELGDALDITDETGRVHNEVNALG